MGAISLREMRKTLQHGRYRAFCAPARCRCRRIGRSAGTGITPSVAIINGRDVISVNTVWSILLIESTQRDDEGFYSTDLKLNQLEAS